MISPELCPGFLFSPEPFRSFFQDYGTLCRESFSFAIPTESRNIQVMSVEQMGNTLLYLSCEDRRQFARWFYVHENEILDPQTDEEISPDLKTQILRRREEALAQPELLEPWGGTTERLRADLKKMRK